MPNADTTLIESRPINLREVAQIAYTATYTEQQRGVQLRPLLLAAQHIPGDTTTPPAPDAVWIGSGDA